MGENVFAGPQELDGHADLLGDGAGFEHVNRGEATTDPPQRASVHDDVVVEYQYFGTKTAIFGV